MSAVKMKRLTADEYLDQEEHAFEKSEYFDGIIIVMTGATPEHNLIASNVLGEARNLLKGSGCRVYNSDQKTKSISMRSYVYPDVTIVCGEPEYDARKNLINPKVIVEVLSDSTEKRDRTKKFDIYSRLASLEQCMLVSQDMIRVELLSRRADGTWALNVVKEIGESIELASIGIRIPLAEIYALVEIPPQGDGEEL